MVDAVIILIVVVLLIFALKGSIKHFKAKAHAAEAVLFPTGSRRQRHLTAR